MMRKAPVLNKILLSAMLGAAVPSAGFAASDKCGESYVDYQSKDGMTQQEKLRAMDRALYDALNKYDDCLTESSSSSSSSSSASSSGSSGGQGSQGAEGSEGSEGAEGVSGATGADTASQEQSGSSPVSSAASSGIQGTEKPEEQATAATASGATVGSSDEGEAGDVQQQLPKVLPNGKIPDDIPPANNDDILQQKVREAAENETDPEKRERLWDEYRKLKGLPKA